jgi:hypothetical protein
MSRKRQSKEPESLPKGRLPAARGSSKALEKALPLRSFEEKESLAGDKESE